MNECMYIDSFWVAHTTMHNSDISPRPLIGVTDMAETLIAEGESVARLDTAIHRQHRAAAKLTTAEVRQPPASVLKNPRRSPFRPKPNEPPVGPDGDGVESQNGPIL